MTWWRNRWARRAGAGDEAVDLPDGAVERTEGPTPAGGAWAVATFLDQAGRPTPKPLAVRVRIVEYAADGSPVGWTDATIGPPDPIDPTDPADATGAAGEPTSPDEPTEADLVEQLSLAIEDGDWTVVASGLDTMVRRGWPIDPFIELLHRHRWARALSTMGDADHDRAAVVAASIVATAEAWRRSGSDPGRWLDALGRSLDGCGITSCCPPSPLETALCRRGHDLRTGRYP